MNNSLLAQTVIFLEISLRLAERALAFPWSERMPSAYSNGIPAHNATAQPERSARVGCKERARAAALEARRNRRAWKTEQTEERGETFCTPRDIAKEEPLPRESRPRLRSFAKAPEPSLARWVRAALKSEPAVSSRSEAVQKRLYRGDGEERSRALQKRARGLEGGRRTQKAASRFPLSGPGLVRGILRVRRP